MFYGDGWQTSGLYRKSIFRRIRDLFDVNAVKASKHIIKKQKSLFLETKKKYIPATAIEDYATVPMENADVFIPEVIAPSNSYVPVVVARPTQLNIPVIIPKFSFLRKNVYFPVPKVVRKDYKLTVPRIKMNITNLRKLGWLTLIVTCIVSSLSVSFIFYRGIKFMDGDYVGEAYRYKMAKFESDLIIPIEARMADISAKQAEIDAKEEARLFREMTGAKIEKPRTYYMRDAASGKLLRVDVK